MKVKVMKPVEIEIGYVVIEIPREYCEGDLPDNFPEYDQFGWEIRVDIDDGQIQCWPEGAGPLHVHLKVRDGGTYTLLDPGDLIVATLKEEYVPNKVVPGDGGDHIILHVNERGVITNWPKSPDVSAFFPAGVAK